MDFRVPLSIFVLLGACAGCRLTGREGPVPQALINSRHYSQLGIAAMDREQWDEAQQLLAKAVRACPQDAEARRNFAEVLWRQGLQAEARKHLEEALRLCDDDATLHTRLAQMLLDAGQIEAAARETELALDLDPRLATAWSTRGRVMLAAGRAQQALADYHRALAYTPDDREILLQVAELYRRLEQPERALTTLQSLAETYAPGEEPQQVLYLLGLAYSGLGRSDDAAEQFALALRRGTASPDLLAELASAQLRCGRATDALRTAREALALEPQHAPSLNLLSHLQATAANETVHR